MTFEEIKGQIASKKETNANLSGIDPKIASILRGEGDVLAPSKGSVIENIDYSASSAELYDRNRFGEMKAKYKTYTTGVGEENRHALQQGTMEKIKNGLVKFGAKIGNYAAESIGTMTYGVYSAIKDRNLMSLYDNDFTRVMDDANKALDRNFAHYYSDEEKSKGLLGKMGTMNFWMNDFAGGLAFIGGAVLPNIVLTPLTGGGSLGVTMARFGAMSLAKTTARKAGMNVLRKGIREGAEATTKKTAQELLEQGTRQTLEADLRNNLATGANIGTRLNEMGKLLKFVGQSTLFEAGMEARHNFHDSVEEYAHEFYMKNGMTPTTEELTPFLRDAERASNGVFLANVALLSITNAAMFGKAFGLSGNMLSHSVSDGANRFGNRLLGLTTKFAEDGTKVAKELSKGRKLVNNAYFIGRKPFSEGVVEEGLQGTFTKTSDRYLKSKYDDNENDSFSLIGAWADSFGEQYGTTDGWHEITVGMLVGMLGGNVSTGISRVAGVEGGKFGVEGFGKSGFGAFSNRFNDSVTAYNKSLKTFKNLNRANSITNFNDEGTSPSYQDVVGSFNFIKANSEFKDFSNIKEDYNHAVDSLEFTDEQLNLFEENQTTAEAYKEHLKQQFKQDFSNYNKASRLTDRLGIDNLDITDGNKEEIKEAIVLQTMLGGKNNDNASKIAGEISAMVGSETSNALRYMDEVVSPRLRESKQNYQKTQSQIDAIVDEIVKVQRDVAGSSTNEAKIELNKKHVVLTQKLTELQNELNSIEAIANNEIKNLSGKFGEISSSTPTITQIIDAENTLQDFIKVLDATGGNSKSLRNKINQYKAYTSTAMEYDSMTQRMLSTNFFKSDEGNRLIKVLTGDKYDGSKEFEQFVKDNETDILKAFGDFGIMPSDIIERIKEHPDLSERAKFKTESLIRASIISGKIQQKAERLTEELTDNQTELIERVSIEDTEGITPTSENIAGDTVKGVVVKERDASNAIEKLTNSINDVAEQIREISTRPLAENQQELKDKQAELERLEKLLANLEDGIVNQQELVALGITKDSSENTKETSTIENVSAASIKVGDVIKTEDGKLAVVMEINEDISLRKGETKVNHFVTDKGVIYNFFGYGWRVQRVSNATTTDGVKQEVDVDRTEINERRKIELNLLEETETITDEEYNEFIDNGVVSEETILSISEKVKRNKPLSQRERAIFNDKTKEINEKIAEIYATESLDDELNEHTEEEVQTEFEWIITRVSDDTSTKQTEVEQEDGHFDKLRDIARKQAEGENISTSENMLLITMYPETFEQYLNEENERINESIGELRNGETIVDDKQTTEVETTTSGESVETQVGQDEIIREAIDRVRERIEAAKSEIEKLKEPLDFTNTEAFKRYVKLRNKGDERTPDEEVEYKSLGDSLNNWTFITGTVVSGVKLTDWINQLEHLKSVEVVQNSDTIEATEAEVEQVQKQLNSQNSYDVAHNFTHVFSARKSTGNVTVSGMTMGAFTDIVGEEIASKTAVGDNGSIIIPSDVVEEINENTKMFISDTIEGTNSLWTMVRMNVNGVLVPIESDFDVKDVETALDQQEVYEVEEGVTDLTFRVNIDSEYNKALLDEAVNEIGMTRELTEEEKEVEIEKTTQLLLASDKTMAKLQGDLLYEQNKKNKTEKDKKKIQTLRERIIKRERDLRIDAKAKVEKAPKKEKALSEETRKKLRDNLRIDIVVNGKAVNFLKAIRGESDTLMKSKMLSLRNELVSDVDALVRSYFTNTPIESNVKLKAVKVLPGQPNFNMTLSSDGVLSKQYNVFDNDMVNVIEDIGYIENGEIKTKSGEAVNETIFVNESLRASKNSDGKIPVVVIRKGVKRIAYPVNVGRETPPVTEAQIRGIQNNTILSTSEKAMQINTLLAKAGIDVRQTGNSIISYSDNTLNTDVLDDIIDRLNNREYISKVDNWISEETTIAEDLVGNASININVREPFLSPKIKLDLKDVKVDDAVIEKTEEQEEKVKHVVPLNSVSAKVSRKIKCP